MLRSDNEFMSASVTKRSYWVGVTVVWLMVALLIAAAIRTETRPLGVDDVKVSASDLRTLANSAYELTNQSLDGLFTETFFKSQKSLIEDKADSEKKSLSTAKVGDEAREQERQLYDIASHLADTLKKSGGRPETAEQYTDDLKDLADRAALVEEQLSVKSESQ